jgi:hypothetical protein
MKLRLSEHIKCRGADVSASLLAVLLRAGGPNAYRNVVNALWERQPVYSEIDIRLVSPSYVAPDPRERHIVERIFAAYRKAKAEEVRRDPIYRPAGGWKNVVDRAFGHLIGAHQNDDIEQFHYFLANFGAWTEPTGIEESARFAKIALSKRKQRHLEQRVMAQLIQWWKTFESDGRDLSALTTPGFGNQGGLRVEGHLILPNAVFSDFYSRLLARLVAVPRPVIAELGGGYGRLCWFLSRNLPASHFVGFDLPECLCCAAYYLMLSYPEKRFVLYGEGDLSRVTTSDFTLFPAFELCNLPDLSVDLFVNENSLGIMKPAACRLFVEEICRTTKAFWHRNHEVIRNPFDDGSESLVNREYPVPRDRFRLVVRDHDVARLVGHCNSTVTGDMVWYHFQRQD